MSIVPPREAWQPHASTDNPTHSDRPLLESSHRRGDTMVLQCMSRIIHHAVGNVNYFFMEYITRWSIKVGLWQPSADWLCLCTGRQCHRMRGGQRGVDETLGGSQRALQGLGNFSG